MEILQFYGIWNITWEKLWYRSSDTQYPAMWRVDERIPLDSQQITTQCLQRSARLNIIMLLASQYMNTNLKYRMKSSYETHRDRQKPRLKYCKRIGTRFSRDVKQLWEHQRMELTAKSIHNKNPSSLAN